LSQISNNNGLVAGVEGLDLWRGPGGDGYLIVSAQSADRFVVYDRLPRGLLVTQDDRNTNPVAAQNYKLIDWAEVEAALGL
jgi:3-phytase